MLADVANYLWWKANKSLTKSGLYDFPLNTLKPIEAWTKGSVIMPQILDDVH